MGQLEKSDVLKAYELARLKKIWHISERGKLFTLNYVKNMNRKTRQIQTN